MTIFSAALSLFLVFNVLGNLPFFIAILKPFTPRRQRLILLRELFIALGILFLFGFFGDNVLNILGITQGIIGVAGGLLLLIIALTMIFPKHTMGGVPDHEPMVVPIAMPVLAGPGSITTVMVFNHQLENEFALIAAIFLAWLPSLLIVMAASNIKHVVGEKGLIAFERFGGLLVALIAIQMISSGVVNLIEENFDIPMKKKVQVTTSTPS